MDDATMEDVPSKISINGVEYDPEEAQSLIELGNKTREFEGRWNTQVDSLMPAYTKSREEIKGLTAKAQELEQKVAQYEAKKEAGVETPEDMRQVQEAARKAGIVLKDDMKGYMSRDEFQKELDAALSRRDAAQKVLNLADELEREINGEDGRPRFNKKQVLAYAQAYGFSDLKEAYQDMFKDSLDSWKKAQVESKRGSSLKTLKSGGDKQPKEVKVNDENVADLLSESLGKNV